MERTEKNGKNCEPLRGVAKLPPECRPDNREAYEIHVGELPSLSSMICDANGRGLEMRKIAGWPGRKSWEVFPRKRTRTQKKQNPTDIPELFHKAAPNLFGLGWIERMASETEKPWNGIDTVRRTASRLRSWSDKDRSRIAEKPKSHQMIW
jgi:hypothetical protein